jgi:hypothetical protein
MGRQHPMYCFAATQGLQSKMRTEFARTRDFSGLLSDNVTFILCARSGPLNLYQNEVACLST